ncbi:TIGR02611 family protein [Streptomyces sp. NBC_00121]|uniref:TIGR02611 family protein n=1 Tax=unclassified Streptomyces TaxID=2593676 RepID=UPI0028C3E48B|nr:MULTISPECIES: TIGR02611 family protein [unclassified Streptomyces]WNO63780.1 TIGR02611 family protein [Streptomyces sp. AM2-3-1]WSC68355.1 TIGR02611 family protein [Streptomyces sp. NBC_01760]WTI86260.1 TIGR02611 family protein [Streptomyces sp. NBC_00724]
MNAESDARDEAAAPAAATGDVTADVAPDVTEGVTKGERELGSRAPGFIKASRALHVSWQVGVFVVGLAVVVAGIIMLPLPGPGWLVIFGGMAIWATEFVWAQLVLRWTRRKVTEAAQKALDPKVRRRNIILTVVGLVIIAVLVGIYVWKFGITMPWKIHE